MTRNVVIFATAPIAWAGAAGISGPGSQTDRAAMCQPAVADPWGDGNGVDCPPHPLRDPENIFENKSGDKKLSLIPLVSLAFYIE